MSEALGSLPLPPTPCKTSSEMRLVFALWNRKSFVSKGLITYGPISQSKRGILIRVPGHSTLASNLFFSPEEPRESLASLWLSEGWVPSDSVPSDSAWGIKQVLQSVGLEWQRRVQVWIQRANITWLMDSRITLISQIGKERYWNSVFVWVTPS